MSGFSDSRLVAVYDTVCAYDPGTQPDFYSALAARVGAVDVADIGCGTGAIARRLAAEGFVVTGLDPSAEMLEVARASDARATWIAGTCSDLGPDAFDLAVMAGHVAQFFVDDREWEDVLRAVHDALRASGVLAFETRSCRPETWQVWSGSHRRTVVDPIAGELVVESSWGPLVDGVAASTSVTRFESSGLELTSSHRLRFRTPDEVRSSLTAAGFVVDDEFGDWNRQPFDDSSSEMIVVAHRR